MVKCINDVKVLNCALCKHIINNEYTVTKFPAQIIIKVTLFITVNLLSMVRI